jgi:thiamine kinase-like enzyme
MVSIEACLPANLRGPSTTITPISAGMSGAGVYRVEAAGDGFVLKVAGEGEPVAEWRRRLRVLQLAEDNALAPRIVHADEERRAVVSAFAAGRPFAMVYGDPRTRDAALAQVAATLRRVHQLPLPPDAAAVDPRQALAATWTGLAAGFAVPAFVADAVRRALAEEPPADDRALVMSHNDVNPGNLVYASEELLLVDWEHAGPNHPFYDLAAISVFLLMDDGTQQRLLAAYDGEPVSALPPRFTYCRRLVAVLCGATFLQIARNGGHPGATGADTPDSTPSLGEFYQRMHAGSLSLATAEGQWRFGLALVKEAPAA